MNIFGKEIQDYAHLRKLADKNCLDGHMNASKSKGKEYNFTALIGDNKFADASPAQNMVYLTNNMQAIQAEVDEILYGEYRLPSLVPINTSIPEGATSTAIKVKNSFGKAGFIDNRGTNASSSAVSYDLRATNILQGGIDAEWSRQELRNAMFAGMPLQTDTIEDATQACLDHMEEVGLKGDAGKGFTGLINNPDVTTIHETAINTLTTAADPAKYINDYINEILVNTSLIFSTKITSGLTIYLPVTSFNFLATTAYGSNKDKTIMEYLSMFNAWTANTGNPIKFQQLVELENAGVLADLTTPANRMLIGFNNKKVMEMGNPIAPRVIDIVNHARWFTAPLEYSVHQLEFKHPKGCLYIDGV